MREYIDFLLRFPFLFIRKLSRTTPFVLSILFGIITLISLGVFGVVLFQGTPPSFSIDILSKNNAYVQQVLIVFLILIISLILLYNSIMKTLQKRDLAKPTINPVYDFATPTDIMNSLREDDKNSLMFGRSKQPTEAMSENSGKNHILRGYVNSGGMGEQYGNFSGMTLYSGPEMYDQRVLTRVFEDYDEYKNTDKIDLRNVPPELQQKADAVQELLDKEQPLSAEDADELSQRRELLFKSLLEFKNKETGIPDEEKLQYSDFL